jgi:hypothetical protein
MTGAKNHKEIHPVLGVFGFQPGQKKILALSETQTSVSLL